VGVEPISRRLDHKCPVLNAAHESGAIDKINGAPCQIPGDKYQHAKKECLPNIL
jgi:hypothetical protein